MRKTITTYLKQLEEFLGYYPVQINSDLLNNIQKLEMGILVVKLILNLVKAILVVISVLIINSLVLTSVESKTFELSVMRMVGQNKVGVVLLIICQVFIYVIPSLITAFSASILILHHLSHFFLDKYKVSIDKVPSLDSSI
jgi:ABC-type antimicrobial peptide transport system permease subunit